MTTEHPVGPQTYDRYGENSLKRKNLIWMVGENWKGLSDSDAGHSEELLEMIISSVASDTEKGIQPEDYAAAVKKYPMLLEFLGEVQPSRPSIATFLATMMPVAKPYAYCPEYRTDHEEEVRPSRAYGASASEEVVYRLGGAHNKGPRTASEQTTI